MPSGMRSSHDLELFEGTFRAFGSSCRIVSDLGEHGVHRSVGRLEDLEARWSRFRSDSEISALNRRSGAWAECSEVTIDLVRRAVDASIRTCGLFNPLVLDALEALGYDRDHRLLSPPRGAVEAGPEVALPSPLEIDVAGGAVRLPAGARFDPGGLGKGRACDLVLDDLLDDGAQWAYVSLGGDVRFGGEELARRGTTVEIQDPIDHASVWGSTEIRGGALASSSTLVRRWSHQGRTHHHLLDRAGRSAAGRRVAATVFAASACWADVVAKCLLIDDRLDRAQVEEWDVGAVVFDRSGEWVAYGWADAGLDAGVS